MCVCALQRYIWWKKSVELWSADHPFPIDIDYMISDTLEMLRPKMRLSCSLEEAIKQVAELEREVLVKLGTMRAHTHTHPPPHMQRGWSSPPGWPTPALCGP